MQFLQTYKLSFQLLFYSEIYFFYLEQLLNGAIYQENAEMEERRKQILRDREEMQEKLYNLQNQLLEDLANSTGDILQNKVVD